MSAIQDRTVALVMSIIFMILAYTLDPKNTKVINENECNCAKVECKSD